MNQPNIDNTTTPPTTTSETTFVYEFLYNSDCCESGPSTISIHKTRKGAEIAMEFHKNEKKLEYEKQYKECQLEGWSTDWFEEYPFDHDQWWGIVETELKE